MGYFRNNLQASTLQTKFIDTLTILDKKRHALKEKSRIEVNTPRTVDVRNR